MGALEAAIIHMYSVKFLSSKMLPNSQENERGGSPSHFKVALSWILLCFSKQLFYRTPPNDYFWGTQEAHNLYPVFLE